MFGGFLIPVLIGFMGIVTFAGLVLWAKRYVKVPPDQVAIVTGRKHKLPNGQVVGFRMVKGGATFVWPIREEIKYLPLSLLTLDVKVSGAYNKDGVPVDIDAVANIKIKSEDQAIANAVERFLHNPEQITETVRQTLEAHLRSIVGTMTIEELNSDRKAFGNKVTEESVGDLERMGIGVDNIGIKKIEDKLEYLVSLGRKRTAEVKRDAEIGEADARAESQKRTSAALREAAEVSAENDRKTAQAQAGLAVEKAKYDADVKSEQARAEQAGLKAKADAEKDVLVAQQAALESQTEAKAKVAVREGERRKQELEATTVKDAEAQKQTDILRAEAAKEVAIREAEAGAQTRLKHAEAEQKAIEMEAAANASRVKQAAEAEASGVRAKLQAEADGIRAKLLAEAEGKEKLAEALKKLDQAGMFMLLSEKAPELIKALGEALEAAGRGTFGSIAAPLGGIDHLTVFDSNSGEGNGALSRVANIVPGILFEFLAKCKANGMDDLGDMVTGVMKMLAASTQSNGAEKGNSHDVSVGG